MKTRLLAPVALLLLASYSRAGFTPPSDPTPFLPPANVVTTVTRVTVIGPYGIYTSNLGWSAAISLKAGDAKVKESLAAVASWQKFRLATVSADSLSNADTVNAAQQWWLDNILPAFLLTLG